MNQTNTLITCSVRWLFLGAALTGLSGCDAVRTGMSDMGDRVSDAFSRGPVENAAPTGRLELEERDVEAPSVFDVTDRAIWDGRPSFGGVWAAYPGNIQPERVRIVNLDNNKSVVGALFRREADNPGPPIELSSDAASALGATPGQPQNVRITALRREPVEVTPPNVAETSEPVAPQGVIREVPLDGVETTAVTTMTDPAEPLATAAEGAVAAAKRRPTPGAAASTAGVVAATPAGGLANPFVQVGTFASAANAAGLQSILTKNSVPALVREMGTNSGKTLYRVLAGPASSEAELRDISDRVSSLGFTDAFPVDK